ncbi:MAG: flagellar type III secretion system pore protein FliP [Nocardioidaceae bacterium]|nr:flagellar type III secretion system pore protein FliP [Nocardioidaceae bacterium]
MTATGTARALVVAILAPLALALAVVVLGPSPADAAPTTPVAAHVVTEADTPGVDGPTGTRGPAGPTTIQIDPGDALTEKPSTPVVLFLGMGLLSLAPAILLTCTSFTKILVVLGLTRNALGLQQTPPNQVLAGLALFLSLFIMAPVLTQMNAEGLQPFRDGEKSQTVAFQDGIAPLKTFMLRQTGDDELKMLTTVAKKEMPATRADVGITTLIPAFILSELKQAFIIGFVIFIPFLVIDIVVSAALMSLGMMMMPPVMVSLPFKLLLFVLVDGWGLVVKSLVASYSGGG